MYNLAFLLFQTHNSSNTQLNSLNSDYFGCFHLLLLKQFPGICRVNGETRDTFTNSEQFYTRTAVSQQHHIVSMSLAKNGGFHLVVVLVNFPCCQ